jgi:hypothetical protein
MTENTPQNKSPFPLSRILRYAGFAILLVMLILSVVFQFTQDPILTDEEIVAETVQAGVDLGLTEVSILTGTPDATAIQATINAGIEATLAQRSLDATATAQPESSNTENTLEATNGVISWVVSLFGAVFGIIVGMWNFAGQGGIFVQLLCCITPVGAIVVGVVND